MKVNQIKHVESAVVNRVVEGNELESLFLECVEEVRA